MAKAVEGEWSSEPAFFEKAVDDKRTVKACVATSPDGAKFVSVREWRNKQDGTPYYTRNSVLVPMGDDKMRDAFVDALTAVPTKPTPAKKAKAAKAAA